MHNFYVLATPIGNLEDITIRALDLLNSVNIIFCEDTLHSKRLLNHYKIKAKLISLHKFNESSREELILKYLNNEDVVLISDAGTPGISDPGQFIIKRLKERNIKVIPLPGPSSITTALSASGLIFKNFVFLGFVNKSSKKFLTTINNNLKNDLLIFFESPKRIRKTLTILKEYYGDVEIVVAKELTKKYEKIIKEKISELEKEENDYQLEKGELVLIINSKNLNLDKAISDFINENNLTKLVLKEKINILKLYFPLSKNYLYSLLSQ